jgi:pimeloyl-ACP methyl ester carboxylesterase
MTTHKEETIKVRGRNTRLYRGGEGPPLLFLHDPFCPAWLPLHEKLAASHEVFVPMHPGFAGSEDHFEEFEEMEDLVFHYLDLCAALGLHRPALAGASLGGWIAAEWAMRYSKTLRALILIDALGLRVPEAPAPDILSLDPAASRQAIFAIRPRLWHWKSFRTRPSQKRSWVFSWPGRPWRASLGSFPTIRGYCGIFIESRRRL